MKDIRQTLSDIHSIRQQVAWSTQFQGYGPASTAFGGALALGVATLQVVLGPRDHTAVGDLGVWIATAIVLSFVSSLDMLKRSRRVHCGFADQMMISAIEQFVPALVAGLLLTVVVLRVEPRVHWMLPGLWELIFSLGIFASCRFLPRLMFAVGVWYLGAGLCSLLVCGESHSFSPWAMGVPFGFGQLAVAGVLRFGFDDHA